MRKLVAGTVLLLACSGPAPRTSAPAPTPTPSAAPPAPAHTFPTERLGADAERTTTAGNPFTAPAGWSITVRGPATILEAPEAGSRIALVDVTARDADAAVAAAWAAYLPEHAWPLTVVTDVADRNGWSRHRSYSYQSSPNERRGVSADALWSGRGWTVAIYDMENAVGERRRGATGLVFESLVPRGYVRESFAGKTPRTLDAARIATLSAWIEEAMRELRVPGVAVGIVQDGKTVFAGGFGIREIGKKQTPDADTLFMIASNTKPLTTLLLAKLVDEKKLSWSTPVAATGGFVAGHVANPQLELGAA